MATIIQEGCVVSCSHCMTRFSFLPSEVATSFKKIPAGYSPEEEAYDEALYSVSCPKCNNPVNVGSALGPEGKRAATARAKQALTRADHDL